MLLAVLSAATATAGAWPNVRIDGGRFLDDDGRELLFRGVNVSGASKVPFVPAMPSHRADGFFAHREVSFVGRPFPLAEADEHFGRLAAWGFNLIRLVTTWEAIEHAGPGIHDEDYIEYLGAIVGKAAEHGLWVLVDPHQDVWSRFTGGDGAPGWTLEAVGFDLEALHPTGAALVHNVLGDPYPKMIWSTNYTKLGSSTMFTLFFAGDLFAPATAIDGVGAQRYLQDHFFASYARLAARLAGAPNVLGYETPNEPHAGWIGQPDLDDYASFPLRLGATPTPFQAMTAGAGLATDVAVWKLGATALVEDGTTVLNAEKRPVWTTGEGVWQRNGVWGLTSDGTPELLRPGHFAEVDGEMVDVDAIYRRFVERFITEIRAADPGALVFVQPLFTHGLPHFRDGELDGVGSSAHWYDSITLVKKRFYRHFTVDTYTSRGLVFGSWRIDGLFAEQVASVIGEASALGSGAATIVGELGIPFDLDGAEAYRTGDFTTQILALDRTLRALEANHASYSLWNYTPDNSNERGDLWNGEDLSIFSEDQRTDPGDVDSGGRALRSAVRPFPEAVAGRIVESSYDIHSGEYRLRFVDDASVATRESRIVLPTRCFPESPTIRVSDGETELDGTTLAWVHEGGGGEHTLTVEPASRPERLGPLVSPWWLLVLVPVALVVWSRARKARAS